MLVTIFFLDDSQASANLFATNQVSSLSGCLRCACHFLWQALQTSQNVCCSHNNISKIVLGKMIGLVSLNIHWQLGEMFSLNIYEKLNKTGRKCCVHFYVFTVKVMFMHMLFFFCFFLLSMQVYFM